MPRTSGSQDDGRRTRCFLIAFLVVALVILSNTGFSPSAAQRTPQNQNSSRPSDKKTSSTKRVFVGRGSDSDAGSRQTIKSDNPLNDYSAYRSGDRFIVVIPNADANAMGKSAVGRGYSDMQVQQRGKDVVLSYKLQPGARPRVEQKFNRLDVVFETPTSQRPATATSTVPATAPPASPSTTTSTSNTRADGATKADGSSGRNSSPVAEPVNSSEVASRPNADATSLTQPAERAIQPTPGGITEPSDTALSSDPGSAATPAPVMEVAAAQPRESSAATTAQTTRSTQTSFSPGAALARNWPIALIAALVLAGLGLLVAARRSARLKSDTAEPQSTSVIAASQLKESTSAVTKPREPAVADPEPIHPRPESIAEVLPIVADTAFEAEAEELPKPADIPAKGKRRRRKSSRVEKIKTGEPQPIVSAIPTSAGEMVDQSPVVVEAREVEPAIEDAAAWFSIITPEEITTVREEPPVLEARQKQSTQDNRQNLEEPGEVESFAGDSQRAGINERITSEETSDRVAAVFELSRLDGDKAFHQICLAFDDEAAEVRNAAARALYDFRSDTTESFTRALREASPDRRKQIGAAIQASGLAGEAIGQLTVESRDQTYGAFSLLFLMAKAGEVQPLMRAIETHPNTEVRLAIVKLLALSGQKEILPSFRRLAVRGSLPTEVRAAVMEAIYQISSNPQSTATVA